MKLPKNSRGEPPSMTALIERFRTNAGIPYEPVSFADIHGDETFEEYRQRTRRADAPLEVVAGAGGLGVVYHGGKRRVLAPSRMLTQARDGGFYGEGFYVTTSPQYARTYGPVVTSYDVDPSARVLESALHMSEAPVPLVEQVKAEYRDLASAHAASRGTALDEAALAEEWASWARTSAAWGRAVDAYATRHGYDVVVHSPGEIVVKNPAVLAVRPRMSRRSGTIVVVAAGPELIERLVKRWPALEVGIRELATNDPTGDLRWLDWGVRQLRRGAEPSAIVEVLRAFFAGRDVLGDPTRHKTLDEARAAIEAASQAASSGGRAEVVYSKDGWTVTQVFDREALFAAAGCQPTKWCVGWDTMKHWNEYTHGGGWRMYVVRGPAAESPYLVYYGGAMPDEIKDRGNAAVSSDAEVHSILSRAGLEEVESEAPWVVNLRGILERYLPDEGWGGYWMFMDDGSYAVPIDGKSKEETIDEIVSWAQQDWHMSEESIQRWGRNSDRTNFTETVDAWWGAAGQIVHTDKIVGIQNPKQRRWVLSWLTYAQDEVERDVLAALDADDWALVPEAAPLNEATWIGLRGLAEILEENPELDTTSGLAFAYAARWMAQGFDYLAIKEAIAPLITDDYLIELGEIDQALTPPEMRGAPDLVWVDSSYGNDAGPSVRAELIPGREYPAVQLWTADDDDAPRLPQGPQKLYTLVLIDSEEDENTHDIRYQGPSKDEAIAEARRLQQQANT